jgi:hypothetical protein
MPKHLESKQSQTPKASNMDVDAMEAEQDKMELKINKDNL